MRCSTSHICTACRALTLHSGVRRALRSGQPCQRISHRCTARPALGIASGRGVGQRAVGSRSDQSGARAGCLIAKAWPARSSCHSGIRRADLCRHREDLDLEACRVGTSGCRQRCARGLHAAATFHRRAMSGDLRATKGIRSGQGASSYETAIAGYRKQSASSRALSGGD